MAKRSELPGHQTVVDPTVIAAPRRFTVDIVIVRKQRNVLAVEIS